MISDSDDGEPEDEDDFGAEDLEVDFGQAGAGGTPKATKKTDAQISALRKKLRSFKSKFMSKEEITEMIQMSNTALASSVEGQIVENHASSMKTLKKIHSAYEELVATDRERMVALKKALEDCKERILNKEVSAEAKQAAIAQIMQIEGMSETAKKEVQEMMLKTMAPALPMKQKRNSSIVVGLKRKHRLVVLDGKN